MLAMERELGVLDLFNRWDSTTEREHMKTRSFLVAIVALALLYQLTWADDKAAKEFEKNFKEYQKFSKEEKGRKDRESMRDKSHDNRAKVDKNTSVGIDKDGVNVRRTTP